MRLLTIALVSFGAIANATIRSDTLGRSGNPNEKTIKEFVELAIDVPAKDIKLRKTSSGTGYNMFVSVGDETQYVFKAWTSRAEIECAKKISLLTNIPEGISLVGVSHIAVPKDFRTVYPMASLSTDRIKTILDKQEKTAAMEQPYVDPLYWSLQPFIGRKGGSNIFSEMEGQLIDGSKWRLLFKRLGKAISYIHSKRIVHKDFNHGNWFFDEETGNLHIIDWGRARFHGVTEEDKLNEKINIIAGLLNNFLYLKFSGQFLSLIGIFLQNLTDISRSDLRSRLFRKLANGLLVDAIGDSDMEDGLSSLFQRGYFDGDDDGKLFETVCLIRIAHLIKSFRNNWGENDQCPSREIIIGQIERAWQPTTFSDEEWKERKSIYKGIINRTDPEQLRAIVNDAPGVLIDIILSRIDAFKADETV